MTEIEKESTAPDTVSEEEKTQFFQELDRLQMNIQELGQLAFA